jgi:hypothetical protein
VDAQRILSRPDGTLRLLEVLLHESLHAYLNLKKVNPPATEADEHILIDLILGTKLNQLGNSEVVDIWE